MLAFMSRPELLVLDEPSSGLDPLMQEELEDLILETTKDGRSVFFSSHVLSEVEQICTRVAMLREGEIVDEFDLAERRRLLPERLTVRFESAPPPAAFEALPGVEVTSLASRSTSRHAAVGAAADALTNGNTEITFELKNGPDALVKRLAEFTVMELRPESMTLEDLFMTYYQHEGASSDASEGDRAETEGADAHSA